MTLSEADRQSYEKVFSSILVPYASLTVGEEIGQGWFVVGVETVQAVILSNEEYILIEFS